LCSQSAELAARWTTLRPLLTPTSKLTTVYPLACIQEQLEKAARTQQLIRAITRYLIWRHPAFTILQQTDALDLAYKVQVNCAARSNKVTYEWDVFDAHTKELVQSGSQNHSAEGNALDTLEHIGEHTGEHIGERIANEILRHRRLGALQI
jgi:hypothetical protein